MSEHYTNALGKYIEANNFLTYSKIAAHTGHSKQTIWYRCHDKPLGQVKLSDLEEVAKVAGISSSELLKTLKGID